MRPKHVEDFVALLANDFYVDGERVRNAVQEHAAFNVIHLPTSFKADIFVLANHPTAQREMDRKEKFTFKDGKSLWVATAEDTILHKLIWYRRGNEVSDRQWRDVLAVLKVSAATLDHGYLDRAAKEQNLEPLLQRARLAAHQPH